MQHCRPFSYWVFSKVGREMAVAMRSKHIVEDPELHSALNEKWQKQYAEAKQKKGR